VYRARKGLPLQVCVVVCCSDVGVEVNDSVTGIDPKQVGVEERVQVASQWDPIAWPVGCWAVERLDVGRFNHLRHTAARNRTLATVCAENRLPERRLTVSCAQESEYMPNALSHIRAAAGKLEQPGLECVEIRLDRL